MDIVGLDAENQHYIIGVDVAKPERKYEFTGETKELADGRVLRRIKYRYRMGDIRQTDMVGGWIESEDNLSHEGSCAVLDEAQVYGRSRVVDDARVRENAVVYNSLIKRECEVRGEAFVHESTLSGRAVVGGYARVIRSGIEGECWVRGHSEVQFCCLRGNTTVGQLVKLIHVETFGGTVQFLDDAQVTDVYLQGKAKIGGGARIQGPNDIYAIGPIGSDHGTLTVYRTASGIGATRGCFEGTLDEFEAAVQKTHGDAPLHQSPGVSEHHFTEYAAYIAFVRSVLQ